MNKLDLLDNPAKKYKGWLLSDFLLEMRKYYPFATLHFGGDGEIIISTGLNLFREGEIQIYTGMFADDSKYQQDGEERLKLKKE